MAWLQNLAGKAEDLLNKIDKNAATVLNDSSQKIIQEEKILIDPEEERSIEIPNETIYRTENATPISPTKTVDFSKSVEIDDLLEFAHESEDDVVEEVIKNGTSSSKSVSSHNSFVLSEEAQNYNDAINKLELDIRDLNKQLLNLQHLYAELRNENTNLQSQVEAANSLVKTAQLEMEQYKARAQRILQEKEDLIALKNEDKSSENSNQLIITYNDELKKEVEFQQSRNEELTEKVKKLTADVTYLQQQIVLNQNASQEAVQILQDNLATEKKMRMMVEEECCIKGHDLQIRTQQLNQQYHNLQLKNAEIEKLQQALKSRTNTNTSGDFELRIKSLTDTLMLKQNALETVTTERNALRLQVEKLETEYQNNLAQLERAQIRVINVNDTDDVKSQVPHFMRLSPFDAGVTRRVKHAYSTLDAISVRTGVFLRRYPVARVFVFCYMVLLQIWALILLFVYAPSSR